jgi:alpha-tubulin suppressor-like RCC1 family protein
LSAGGRPANAASVSAAQVSAGDTHACALTTGGGAKCWGNNSLGQLGNGSTTNSSTPVDVTGLTSGVAAVSASRHACALTNSGGVKCWGANSYGQLGNGTTTASTTPVDVTGLTSGVAAVSVGGGNTATDYTCALTTGGGVQFWGANNYGQLGIGTTANSTTPVDVSGLTSGVATVSAGGDTACAMTAGGGLKCWGYNRNGQLGNGTTGPELCGISYCSKTPIDVYGFTGGAAAIEVGLLHACLVTVGGGAKCWGANDYGQLGAATAGECDHNYCSRVPVDVTGLTSGASAVSAGGFFSCAIASGGVLKCWGANQYGQLGNGTTTNSGTPSGVVGLTGPKPTPTPTLTPLPPKDPDADTDGDTLLNGVDPDDDNDGCPDVSEVQTSAGSQLSGGLRNPHDPNDYFNPSHDGQNRVDDVLLVASQYFDDDSDGNPGLPPYAAGYDPDTDRTFVGPLAWNLGAPDGLQRVDDILNQVKQYFHDCA